MVFSTVSLVSQTMYKTLQLCEECLTGLTFVLRVAQESIFKHQHSTQQ